MTVIEKKVGGVILFGNLRVVVKRADGNKVVLGIDAPREVPIARREALGAQQLDPERRRQIKSQARNEAALHSRKPKRRRRKR